MSNKHVMPADMDDPETQTMIKRNVRVALEATALIVKRHKKVPDDVVLEHIVNTIGIQAAEIITAVEFMIGMDAAVSTHEIILNHINARLDLLRSTNEPVQ